MSDFNEKPEWEVSEKRNLYVIDDLNLIFRMFYGVPPMNSPDNIPTNVVYGYLKAIKYIYNHSIEKTGQDPVILVATDIKWKSGRVAIYEEYKANRTSEMPDNCKVQIPLVTQLLEIIWINKIGFSGKEADDIIGSLAHQYKDHFNSINILSSDKDLCQLIDTNVFCMDSLKQITWDNNNVKDKFGIDKEYIVDYLSLLWDSSDNIPWVKGIGEKSAVKLIEQFGHVEDMYSVIALQGDQLVKDKVLTQSIYDKLVLGEDMAFMSKTLATIDIHMNIEDLVDVKNINTFNINHTQNTNEQFQQFCKDMNIKSFIKNVVSDNFESKSFSKPIKKEQKWATNLSLF